MKPIKAWSFSLKKNFDTCPYILHHRNVLKSKKLPQDPDSPLVRGLELHKKAEDYIKLSTELPEEFSGLRHEFQELYDDAHESDDFEVEKPIAFDRYWKPVDWYDDEAWLRVSFDLQIGINSDTTRIVDYKTGKKEGNELSHMLQGQLYAVAALARNSKLKEVLIEFFYLDHDQVVSKVLKREFISNKKRVWDRIGKKITGTQELKPKPSKWGCKFCDYNPVCDYAIREGDL